jgi:hypothetical protein
MLTAFFRSVGALPIFIFVTERNYLSIAKTKELHCIRLRMGRSPKC